MNHLKSLLADAKCIVIKVGSSLVTNNGEGLDQTAIAAWAAQIAQLVKPKDGLSARQVVLVSSGAVAEGMQRLGWKKRPTAVNELQAAAAVGQMGLVQMYESCFSQHAVQGCLHHYFSRAAKGFLLFGKSFRGVAHL